MPDLLVISRQRSIRYDHPRLTAIVHAALPMCLKVAAKLGGPLLGLKQIECTVVGSPGPAGRMAREQAKILKAASAALEKKR